MMLENVHDAAPPALKTALRQKLHAAIACDGRDECDAALSDVCSVVGCPCASQMKGSRKSSACASSRLHTSTLPPQPHLTPPQTPLYHPEPNATHGT